MNVEVLARIQFVLAISFHYIFSPLNIGLGLVLIILQCLYMKTNNPLYKQMSQFWVSMYALIYCFGALTGFAIEHEMGTTWAVYSQYIHHIFGKVMGLQAGVSFFLESLFLSVLVFGRNKLNKAFYFLFTVMAGIMPHLSAAWIVAVNSWQQTPRGFHIVGQGLHAHAEITDFWAMMLNPSAIDRISHVICAAWLTGAFFVLSVSAYYLLKKQHLMFAKSAMKIALVVSLAASLLQLATGHMSAVGVSRNQPAKLAAFEGHFHSQGPADLHLLGWVDEKNKKTWGISIPRGLSFLTHGDFHQAITGLDVIPKKNQPPVNFVFQTYHLMIAIGMALIGLSLAGICLWQQGRLFDNQKMLWLFAFSGLLPQLANQAGWYTAEVGRQPWIIYGLLRTSEGLSMAVRANQVIDSITVYIAIYLLLFSLFVYVLVRKVRQGPPTMVLLQNLKKDGLTLQFLSLKQLTPESFSKKK
jgi:cytochrome d ubiquinol oxidase subunit I